MVQKNYSDISHNSLTEIPEQIGNLKNLEYL